MNERHADFEALQAFVRRADQEAFAALVRRHVDLVFGTALRKLTDTGAAEEVAQNVFSALARKAWQFAPDDSLPAWLHKTALLECTHWLRGELRRRRREQTAAQLGTTMNSRDGRPAAEILLPLLDEGLLSLREKDRTVLLLRYQESQTLREVGLSLGIREDAAQKRVASALARLSGFFHRRGYRTVTATVLAVAMQQSATSASAATVGTVIHAALHAAPPAVLCITVLARLAAMSKAQLAAACLALAAIPVGWQWRNWHGADQEMRRARAEVIATQAQFSAVETEIQQLTIEARQVQAANQRTAAAAALRSAAERELGLWKTQVRAALTAEPYRWPEDSPFVRIPKSALREVQLPLPIEPSGALKPVGRELLGLSPQERADVEEQLRNHIAEFEGLSAAALIETNRTDNMPVPGNASAFTIFCLPALGDAAKRNNQQLVAELKPLLGEQRWSLLEPILSTPGTHPLRRLLGFGAEETPQQAAVWIQEDASGPKFGYSWSTLGSSFSSSGGSLELVLSDAETSRFDSWRSVPSAVAARVMNWLRTQAEARLRATPD